MELRPIKNKKGAAIATNTIIIIIIALLVLVVLVAFFAGGMAQLVQNIKNIFYGPSAASEDVVIQQCKVFCTTLAETAYCRTVNVEGIETGVNCADLLGENGCAGITCPEIDEGI